MLDIETRRRIDAARDILVGKVPDPKSQVEQITIALIYKFMDDMDSESEEMGGERKYFIGEYSRYAWHKLMDRSLGGYDVLNLYSESILKMNQNPNVPQLFRDIFKNAYLPYRDPETLKAFLKTINDFTYDHSEKLGDAFEYLLSVLGSQGDAGQFRTPRHIIDFMVAIIEPQKHESILDPACGTAGFLISSYKHILKNNSSNYDPGNDPTAFEINGVRLEELGAVNGKKYKGDKLTPDERTRLMNNIRGYDISPDMVRLSLVNLYLHGFTDPHIFEYDTLTSEERWNEYADVILANPPFMSPKGGIRPHKRFSVTSSRSEVLFVDYMAEHLTPSGKAAIIVPEGIIFQSGIAYKTLRKMLVEENYLVGVISLPSGVFQPYSGVKTSILWLDRSLAKKTDKILFVKISNDGFDLGAQRRPIKQNDMPEAFRNIVRYKETLLTGEAFNADQSPGFTVAEKTKIAANGDFNFSAERYKEVGIINTKFNIVRVDQVFSEIRNGENVNQIDDIGKYRVTRIQTISNGVINLNATKWTNDEVIEEKYMREGDILLSHINSIDHLAKSAIFKQQDQIKVIHGINLIRLRSRKDIILPEYAIRIIKSDLFISKAKSFAQRAVNQASIRTQDIKSILIPLPSLSVQHEIADEIEGYQKIIDGARQVVENWKPRIDIDPEWSVIELGEVCQIQRGGSPRPINDFFTDAPEGINWIKIGDAQENDKYILKTKQKIKREGVTKTRLVRDGDFILSNSMSYGRPYIVKIDGAIHDGWLLLRIKDSTRISQDYLYYILSSDQTKSQYERMATGGVVNNLNSSLVSEVKIPIPDIEIQNRIVLEIEQERSIIDQNKKLLEMYEQKIKDRIARVWGE